MTIYGLELTLVKTLCFRRKFQKSSIFGSKITIFGPKLKENYKLFWTYIFQAVYFGSKITIYGQKSTMVNTLRKVFLFFSIRKSRLFECNRVFGY